MDNDLISKTDLLNALKQTITDKNPLYHTMYALIDSAYTYEQPQGEWVDVIDYIKHLKETTGETYLVNSTYYDCEVYCNKCWEMSTKRYKFCPNCGAKMKRA